MERVCNAGYMSGFWSGAISALLGALVGGIFTALSVRWQVKASIETTRLQLEAMTEQQRESARMAMLQRAVAEMQRALGGISAEIHEHEDRHQEEFHNDDKLGEEPASHDPDEQLIKLGNQWRRQLDHLQFTYGGYLTDAAIQSFETVFEYLPLHSDVERLRKKVRETYPTHCLIIRWLDELWSKLDEATDDVSYYSELTDQVPFHVTLEQRRNGTSH